MSFLSRISLLVISFAFAACAHGHPASAARPQEPGFPVAAVQYAVRGSVEPDALLAKFERLIREAAQGGAKLVVFPELFTLDVISYRPGARAEAEQIVALAAELTPKLHAAARRLAQELQVSVLAGTSPRRLEDGAIVNTAALALPDGRIELQDKLFLTPDEQKWGWRPGRALRVLETPWGRSAILICYDSEFPGISNLLAAEAPEVLLVPSMTSDAHGLRRVRWTSQARAIEHHAYVVVTGTTLAEGAEWPNQGQAAFLTPSDRGFAGVLAEGRLDHEEIVHAKLDLERLRGSRARAAMIYPARDQNERRSPVVIEKASARRAGGVRPAR